MWFQYTQLTCWRKALILPSDNRALPSAEDVCSGICGADLAEKAARRQEARAEFPESAP